MPRSNETALIRYVAAHPDSTSLFVAGTSDTQTAGAALRAAAQRIRLIPSPYEPQDPLPNWCDVEEEDGVPVLHLDMKDEASAAPQVVRIVLDAVTAAGVDGVVRPWERQAPEPTVPYNPEADIYSDADPLDLLDSRGLPPIFPEGFPVPSGALVLAQRMRHGDAEHAVWRGPDPFPGYFDELRAFGCEFGLLPRLVTRLDDPTRLRYDVWRDGDGGRVTRFQADYPPYDWFLSVVWQRNARRPATPVEPSEAADDRPVPTGRGSVRDMAEYLVPAELVDGYETVVALATAAQRLEMESRAAAGSHRQTPAGMAGVMQRRGLETNELAWLRHVCVTLIRNLHDRWGRRGSTFDVDDDRLLYDARTRAEVQNMVEESAAPAFETMLELLEAARYAAEAMQVHRLPAMPPAEEFTWLFADLDSTDLDRARDTAWFVAGM